MRGVPKSELQVRCWSQAAAAASGGRVGLSRNSGRARCQSLPADEILSPTAAHHRRATGLNRFPSPGRLRPASALSTSNSRFPFRRAGTSGESAMESATRLARFDATGARMAPRRLRAPHSRPSLCLKGLWPASLADEGGWRGEGAASIWRAIAAEFSKSRNFRMASKIFVPRPQRRHYPKFLDF